MDLLKIGLSGMDKRYGYKNVQEFSHIYHKSYNAYIDYTMQEFGRDIDYGKSKQKQDKESVHERLIQPLMETSSYQQQRAVKN